MLAEGTKVRFDNGVQTGIGIVRGIATVDQVVIGYNYILANRLAEDVVKEVADSYHLSKDDFCYVLHFKPMLEGVNWILVS